MEGGEREGEKKRESKGEREREREREKGREGANRQITHWIMKDKFLQRLHILKKERGKRERESSTGFGAKGSPAILVLYSFTNSAKKKGGQDHKGSLIMAT